MQIVRPPQPPDVVRHAPSEPCRRPARRRTTFLERASALHTRGTPHQPIMSPEIPSSTGDKAGRPRAIRIPPNPARGGDRIAERCCLAAR